MKLKAFTLAEVLITLGIIGVVAAMTMPVLMASTQKKELQTGLQKAYSTLSQALIMYENDNGLPVTSNVEVHGLKPILMKYINTAKDCGKGSSDAATACIKNTGDVETESDIYKTLIGARINLNMFDDGQFVMNDNMLVLIENYHANIVYISVDVNGMNKKPNRLGQDLFMFQLDDKGKLLPMGAEGTYYYSEMDAYCSRTSTGNMNGAGCTVKALSDKDFFKNLPK